MEVKPKPGSRLMPLHIYFISPHYVLYEVSLGGLTYMGSFTEAEFLEWLRTSIKDRKPVKRTDQPTLNIELEL